METKWVIASIKGPTKPNEQSFLRLLRDAAVEYTVIVLAIRGERGPGCYNYGFRIQGNENDALKYIEAMTMALQPGKYSRCGDEIEGFQLKDLVDE